MCETKRETLRSCWIPETFTIVSSFVLLNSIDEEVQGHLYKEKNVEENLVVFIKKTSHLKCLRCWQYDKNVLKDEGLCLRCKMTLEQHE